VAPDACHSAPACDPASGECVAASVENGTPCDDGSACTASDTYIAGGCKPESKVSCNDGNKCTDDACAPKVGCTFVPNTAQCNDGNACTKEDKCTAGVCQGKLDDDAAGCPED